MRVGEMHRMLPMSGKFVPVAIVMIVIVGIALAGFAWNAQALNLLSTLQTIRVATVPESDPGAPFVTALAEETSSRDAKLQFSLLETPNVWASAQALHEQKVDAAVVRSDDPAAAEGRALFVLRHLYVALLVPAPTPVDGISKLKGRRIGVVAGDRGIDPMIKVVLDFYGFDEQHIVRLGRDGLPAALHHKQVAAVLVVGPTGAGPIADAVEAFRTATKRPPKFLDLSEAKAIAAHFAVYGEDEISAGAFGGSPALPPGKVATISTRVLLVAQAALSNYAAGEITRLMLATKSRLAITRPDAGQLAAPSTDTDALLPAHPGTIAFLSGEQPDLLDRSINLILLASMLAGLLGSFVAWLRSLRSKRKGQEARRRLLAQARAAGPAHLDTAEKEIAHLSQWLAQRFMNNETSSKDLRSAEAKVAHVGALIQKEHTLASIDRIEQFFQQWRSSAAGAGIR
jgi:TRAP transporter TAXI family solute receptor